MDIDLEAILPLFSSEQDKEQFELSVLAKKREYEKEEQNEKKCFFVRKLIIFSYFSQLSWQYKYDFLLEFAQRMNFNVIHDVYNHLLLMIDKFAITACSSKFNNIHIKMLNDENRNMDKKTIKSAMFRDTEWLTGLNSTIQVIFFLELLDLSGGITLGKIFLKMRRIYNHKKILLDLNENPILREKDIKMDTFEEEKCDEFGKYMEIDKCHPLSIEIMKARRKFNDILLNYRLQITRLTKIPDEFAVEHSSNKKETKTSKSNSRKQKKKQRKDNEKFNFTELDWIQMLPIWIVKKIFNYLDNKTLMKIKRVNIYWSYIVSDLKKDLKINKLLINKLTKLKNNLDKNELTQYENYDETKYKETDVALNNRLQQLLDRGCTSLQMKDIKEKLNPNTAITTTLLETTLQKNRRLLSTWWQSITTFPRPKDAFYNPIKNPPCSILEKNIQENQNDLLTFERNWLLPSESKVFKFTPSTSDILSRLSM